ncbi:probable G-protein coupled receptor 174 [Polypterus senegalus]|uniref:probable G-protein coupled receptor 174 n=1 Tax=Polypterus senegalus TaxID=55291 RepID=UPI001962C179|nr:probable G-protein coupled receptor 174 [Polypterus senegalus]
MANSSMECGAGKNYIHFTYAVTYTVILVPGLIGNVLALWIFYIYIKETKKAVIFMINLALADLAQVLSLPLRIYYYLNNSWPFGEFICMFCFYLKYVNMYASIFFLACISVRRCLFIIDPLRYTGDSLKRKCDVYVSIIGWFVVCLSCLSFPLMRRDSSSTHSLNKTHCFTELPVANLTLGTGVTMMILGEMMGFLLPLCVIFTCSWKTAMSLLEENGVQDSGEKKKAFKMVLCCAIVFLICFAPYHITFPFHFLVMSGKLSTCSARTVILHIHPITLCLASMNSVLDPIMYYFTTDEFKRRFSRQELLKNGQFHRIVSCPVEEDQNGTGTTEIILLESLTPVPSES